MCFTFFVNLKIVKLHSSKGYISGATDVPGIQTQTFVRRDNTLTTRPRAEGNVCMAEYVFYIQYTVCKQLN